MRELWFAPLATYVRLDMLRGKFGQIGKEFRDGHITMDAFEQVGWGLLTEYLDARGEKRSCCMFR